MNYKVMQRPMFRLGGSARKNYQNGTDLSEIEKLINKRAIFTYFHIVRHT